MNEYGKKRQPFLFVIDYKFLTPLVIPLSEINPDEIRYQIDHYSNGTFSGFPQKKLEFNAFPESIENYARKFRNVIHHLKQGNTYLANLTCSTPVHCNYSLQELFAISKARFKLMLKDRFVVFSPEIFVTINKGNIASFPMKGTIDANIPDAKKILLEDPKEKAEHYTIVDLIRNDLNQVASEVRVENFRYIDRIETIKGPILQVSSKISGTLKEEYQNLTGTLFSKLLPAGSVTGAPKEKTISVLDETEQYERGYYTGVFGIFDGANVISAVMIRFLEQHNEGFVYKSGGGITASSQLETEYNEMIKKIYVPVD